MEGTKSKKEEMRGHLCQINTWYESLRWHYPNQVKGRNGITLPLSRFSPAPPVYKKTLFNRYYSLAYRKMQENFSAGKKKGRISYTV